MPVFPKPTVAYEYDVATERRRLRAHRVVRGIPDREPGTLLVGPSHGSTWPELSTTTSASTLPATRGASMMPGYFGATKLWRFCRGASRRHHGTGRPTCTSGQGDCMWAGSPAIAATRKGKGASGPDSAETSKQLAERQPEAGDDVVAVQSPVVPQVPHGQARPVDVHLAPLRSNNPHQPGARGEVVFRLPRQLGHRVVQRADLDRKVRRPLDEPEGHLAAGGPIPGHKAQVRSPHRIGIPAQHVPRLGDVDDPQSMGLHVRDEGAGEIGRA